ncbi:integrase, catalytic region, zinc finger, CCHC-type containing protein [Tanacetum coccineum]
MGIVRFGNDNFAAIAGYGEYPEVAFRSNTYFVRNLEGKDLLTGSREFNLYTISISKMAVSSLVCLMSKATSIESWARVLKIRSDNGTEFENATLKSFYEKLGIMHQTSIAQAPQQNGVVKRRNRTLVEAARTMLIFSKLPKFLWAEAILQSVLLKIIL